MNTDCTNWVDKYRPTTLDEYVCNDEIKVMITDFISNKNIPNLLLCGQAGIGKTSLARLIVKELDVPSLYINAATESGVDVIRSRVTDFTEAMTENIQIVILDEACSITAVAQAALKNVMELNPQTRFILTCNNPGKIIEPIKSRAPVLSIAFSKADVTKHIVKIMKAESIPLVKDDIGSIRRLVDNTFPDIRKCLNKAMSACSSGKFNYADTLTDNDEFVTEFFTKIEQEAGAHPVLIANNLRSFWINSEHKFSADYVKLSNEIFTKAIINDSNSHTKITSDNAIGLADWIYKVNMAVDKEVIFYGFVLKLLVSLKTKS